MTGMTGHKDARQTASWTGNIIFLFISFIPVNSHIFFSISVTTTTTNDRKKEETGWWMSRDSKGTGSERIVWAPTGSIFFYFLTDFLCSFLVPYLWQRRRTTGEWGWRMTRESLLFLYSYYSFLTNFYICLSIIMAYLWCQWQRRRTTGLDECNHLARCRNRIFFSSSFFVVFRLVCPLETITIAIEILLLLYLIYHSFFFWLFHCLIYPFKVCCTTAILTLCLVTRTDNSKQSRWPRSMVRYLEGRILLKKRKDRNNER